MSLEIYFRRKSLMNSHKDREGFLIFLELSGCGNIDNLINT